MHITRKNLLFITIILLAISCLLFSVQAKPEKKPGLSNVKEGILFRYINPNAKTVYLAGDFNNWAGNDQGKVTDQKFTMIKKEGAWESIVTLSPGDYKFKYVVDGDQWFADPTIADMDNDGNSVFKIDKNGKISIQKNDTALLPKKVKDGVLFQFEAKDASIVYLAGDFNNWANNDQGKVTDQKFAMIKKNNIWQKTVLLNPGTYKFKYVVDGDQWSADPNIKEKDNDGNSIIIIK